MLKMSDEIEDLTSVNPIDSQSIIPSFPKLLHVFYYLLYVAPLIATWTIISVLGFFSFADSLRIFMNPFAIAIAVIYYGFIIFMDVYFTKKIRKYDGSEKSIDVVNKTVKTFEFLSIATGVLNAFIISGSVLIGSKYTNIAFDFVPFLTCCLGSVFIFALFFYIIWMQMMERHLSELPLFKKYKSMDIIVKNGLITFFSSVGTLLWIITPILAGNLRHISAYQLLGSFIFPLGLLGAVLTVVCSLLQTKGTSDRIREVSNFTDILVKRDYTKGSVPVKSRDEFGLLIKDINIFYSSTKELLNEIKKGVDLTMENSDELATKMSDTSAAMEQILANIGSVKERIVNQSASVNESQATIQNMLNSISELDGSVEKQVTGVNDSSSAIEEMVANINSVAEILDKNSVAVNSLSEEAERGREKIQASAQFASVIIEKSAGLFEASNVIQSIASQTNLLAMNAAIEAAHAGESGKGFSVVADEIRKLAEQSNTQGKGITTQLKDLQDAINNITNNTTDVQKQFDVIFDLTGTVRNQEAVIRNAMEEQTAGSSTVLQAISDIKATSALVKDKTSELLEGGQQIGEEMNILADVTTEITSSMNEMVAGAEQVTKAVEEVKLASDSNREGFESVGREVNKFTI